MKEKHKKELFHSETNNAVCVMLQNNSQSKQFSLTKMTDAECVGNFTGWVLVLHCFLTKVGLLNL